MLYDKKKPRGGGGVHGWSLFANWLRLLYNDHWEATFLEIRRQGSVYSAEPRLSV